VVSGKTVDVTAKSLDITSTQDVSTYTSANQSEGLNLSYNITTGQVSGAVNAGFGNASDNYKSVTTQSGIVAGSGGYNIYVAGNTNLTGGVISSTAPASANSLTTGTLTASSLANSESYNDNQTSFGIGLTVPGGSSKITQDTSGQANTNGSGTPLSGVKIAGLGTVSATPPVAMSASGNQASTTQSAIAPGAVTITSGDAASQATAAQLQANSSANSGALTQQWTPALQAQIAQGFAATTALVDQAGQFLSNMAAKHDAAQKTLATGTNPDGSPLTVDQISALQQTVSGTATWGAGGTGRLVMTAITGAAGSNVTGSLSGLVQSAAVTTLQGLGTQAVKQIVSSLETQNPDGTLSTNATSETARTLLQGLTACAGSSASGSGDCGAAAMGASASVVLNDLIAQATNAKNGNVAVDAQGKPITQAQQTATANLVSTLVAGIANGAGLNANAANIAAQVETLNNSTSCIAGTAMCITNGTGPSVNVRALAVQYTNFSGLLAQIGGAYAAEIGAGSPTGVGSVESGTNQLTAFLQCVQTSTTCFNGMSPALQYAISAANNYFSIASGAAVCTSASCAGGVATVTQLQSLAAQTQNAEDVYNSTPGTLTNGYRAPTSDEIAALNISISGAMANTINVNPYTGNIESTNRDGFKAQIYVTGNSADGTLQYSVAFRGTQGVCGMTSPCDAPGTSNDVQNAMGLPSSQYTEAAQLAAAIANGSDLPVVFTGQSLGGGLASTAAIASGYKAVTINSAGIGAADLAAALTLNTNYGLGGAGSVDSFYVAGEPLNSLQNSTADHAMAAAAALTAGAVLGAPQTGMNAATCLATGTCIPPAYGNLYQIPAVVPPKVPATSGNLHGGNSPSGWAIINASIGSAASATQNLAKQGGAQ